MNATESITTSDRRPLAALAGGATIGFLSGLIGLGGAGLRLPLLIGVFRFRGLEAIILNKTMSLIVVAAALIFRAHDVSFALLYAHRDIVANVLAGSLLGSWCGASWAARMHSRTLYRALACLLVGIVLLMLLGHARAPLPVLPAAGPQRWLAGAAAGYAIGVLSALMGSAGGELQIPTLVLLFGLAFKLAGSLSLVMSLPMLIVSFGQYHRDRSFEVIGRNRLFVALMAGGSIIGALIGGVSLGLIPGFVLYPVLALILLASAVKLWLHEEAALNDPDASVRGALGSAAGREAMQQEVTPERAPYRPVVPARHAVDPGIG